MSAPGPGAAPDLAVVVKGYPRLSETFVAQELKALEDRGLRFEIWSLRAPYDGGRTHALHDATRAPRRYLPEYLHEAPGRVWRAWRAARRLPGYRAARAAWLADLRRDPTRNRVRRFGQACVLAAELPAATRFLYAHFLHTPASVARYAATMRGLEWGCSAHAKDIWTTPEPEKRAKLAHARFAVACTATGAAHLASLAPAGRVSLVYHGLDLARFPEPPGRPPRPAGRLHLLAVGRLVEKKGFDILLAALARLPARLDWHLTHIGGGDLARQLAGEARRLGLEDRIDWRGKQAQDAVIEAMRAADLFVLPARIARDGDRDGLPNVLMEAASQGLAIVSTRLPGVMEFLPDDSHAALVPPDDPQALAAALLTLANDPARAEAMAGAARARLLAHFGMEAGMARLAALLSEALAAADTGGQEAAPAPEAA